MNFCTQCGKPMPWQREAVVGPYCACSSSNPQPITTSSVNTPTPPPAAPDGTALVIERLNKALSSIGNHAAGLVFKQDLQSAITHLAAHAELQARCARLEDSLADMVDMSETLIKNIAEFSKDSRILTAKSPRLEIARALLAARTAKEVTP